MTWWQWILAVGGGLAAWTAAVALPLGICLGRRIRRRREAAERLPGPALLPVDPARYRGPRRSA